jgi:hypothetical protein
LGTVVSLGIGQCKSCDVQTVGRDLTDVAFSVVDKSGDAQKTLLMRAQQRRVKMNMAWNSTNADHHKECDCSVKMQTEPYF